MKKKLHSTGTEPDTAVLVGLIQYKQAADKTKEYLEELAFLAGTLGVITKKTFTQTLDRPDPRTFIKKGKLQELADYVRDHEIDVIIFDDELSGAHARNIEAALKKNEVKNCRLLDRSFLILEIFSKRAKTAQAETQVALARYQYMLPRLTRMWTHLSRQKGGIGMRGGAGEKELETDRRIIRDRVTLLKEKLSKIEKQSDNRRKKRERMVRVSLVGYTNVGKSTLMRRLAKADVFAEDKLFATVDSTVRKVVLDRIPFLLTDTVGFIRKLPTTLIECFKSTLAEIVEADILLHVVDVSHPGFEEHIEVVNKTLEEIGATNKTVIMVFNKIDQYSHELVVEEKYLVCPPTIEELQETYMAKGGDSVFISAKNKTGLGELRELLSGKVKNFHYRIFPNYLNDSRLEG